MKIREATVFDLPELMTLYDIMCEMLGKQDFLPDGNKGGFPPRELVEQSIANHQQFVGEEDGRLVAAYILNHDCDAAYHTVSWPTNVAADEFVVMHALRVLPAYGGRGYSRQMVEHAIETAKRMEQKAFRLDVLDGNDAPVKMYLSYGFYYVGTIEITYPDIGRPMPFHLYELAL